jgi:Sec-independent protein translocase protein TatA
MFSLNPEKLFIVLIVALVLLGPDKLPKLARQIGAGWSKIKEFQQRIETEVRETMPNLPSSHEIARIARSPVSYLNSMAASGDDALVPDPGAAEPVADPTGAWPADPAAPTPVATTNGHGSAESFAGTNGHDAAEPTLVRPIGIPGHQVPADPGMN